MEAASRPPQPRALSVLPSHEARDQLTSLLKTFRKQGADAEPVVFGAHRKPEGVILSYERFSELMEALDDLAIFVEVRERLAQDTGERIELEDAMRELGYDPAEFGLQ